MVWRARRCSMRSGWCTSRSWEKPLSRGRRMPARTGSVSTSWPSYWTPCRRSDNHVHMFWTNKDIYRTQSPHKASTQPHALCCKYIPVLVNVCISTVNAALSLERHRSTSASMLLMELETYTISCTFQLFQITLSYAWWKQGSEERWTRRNGSFQWKYFSWHHSSFLYGYKQEEDVV